MVSNRYTVYHLGIHTEDVVEPERRELERVGARQVILPGVMTEDEMTAQTPGADGLIIMEARVSRRVMEALPDCKVVLRTGVGVDTIDVEAATEHGIAVVNVPDLWLREVANHALGLILALNRKLFLQDRIIREGEWLRVIPPPVGSLHGETLGIVGLGQIGRLLARRAAALELNVIAIDPYIEASVFEEFGAESVSFEELLRRSDYVSIHTPLTGETHHMFDEAALRQMKPTAYLVNTARGPIVSGAALARALQQEWIAGAGIDVFEEEPPGQDSPLLRLDNVIVTGHTGYYSDAALMELAVRCGQEVARVLTGRMPRFLVNPEVLERLPLKAE